MSILVADILKPSLLAATTSNPSCAIHADAESANTGNEKWRMAPRKTILVSLIRESPALRDASGAFWNPNLVDASHPVP